MLVDNVRNAAGRNYAAGAATCGSAKYHASIVHPQAQQLASSMLTWRVQKSNALRWRLATLIYDEQLYDEYGWRPGALDDELPDDPGDWLTCGHRGEDVQTTWKNAICAARLFPDAD